VAFEFAGSFCMLQIKKKKKPLPFDDYDLPKSHFNLVCHRQGTAPDEAYMISAFGGSG